jgi:hypothetical protein
VNGMMLLQFAENSFALRIQVRQGLESLRENSVTLFAKNK